MDFGLRKRAPSRAVFLGKDGTLFEDVACNVDVGRMRLTRGAVEGLKLLDRNGYALVVVSNQPGVALGSFTERHLRDVALHLKFLLAEHGVPLAGFYYCPHHPEGTVERFATACVCRKPAPGLLTRAAREHHLRLADSWLVGDVLDDVEAGRRAGCRTVLIDNGNETSWKLTPWRVPTRLATDLADAADAIVSEGRYAREREREERPGGFLSGLFGNWMEDFRS